MFTRGQPVSRNGVDGGFPIGTIMLFVQAIAPLGWMKLVAINDYSMRIVSGTTGGATTVGGNGFSTVFGSNFTTANATGTGNTGTGSVTQTTGTMAAHAHGPGSGTNFVDAAAATGGIGAGAGPSSLTQAALTASQGGGSALSIPALTIPALTIAATTITLKVNYIDVIQAKRVS